MVSLLNNRTPHLRISWPRTYRFTSEIGFDDLAFHSRVVAAMAFRHGLLHSKSPERSKTPDPITSVGAFHIAP